MHTTWDVLQSYWTSDGLPLYCSHPTGEKTHTNQQCEILAKIRQTTGICLSSLCVMYPMSPVFILNCCCFVCHHSVSCTQCCPCSFLIVVALFVFVLCFSPMLPVSFDCPFLIASFFFSLSFIY